MGTSATPWSWEYIHEHATEHSRFLARGVHVRRGAHPGGGSGERGRRNRPTSIRHSIGFISWTRFLSFDDDQEAIYRQPPPLVIIGSAGSGKTALTLEKLKDARGDCLDATRSPFLAQNARDLYYANGFGHGGQEIVFLSFREYRRVSTSPGLGHDAAGFRRGWYAAPAEGTQGQLTGFRGG